MDFLTAIALLAFAWAATLSGVIVGGHLVFRASGNYGRLFGQGQGGAYNIEDGTEEREIDFEQDAPEALRRHMDRFKSSFDPGETIFGAAAGGQQGYGRHGAARPFTPPVPPKPGQADDEEGYGTSNEEGAGAEKA